MGAALLGRTPVRRTGIAVIAVGGDAPAADALLTFLAQCAQVAVAARAAAVERYQGTLPQGRLASGSQALGPQTLRFLAHNYRPRIHRTGLGKLLSVAEQGAVAEIPILQSRTVLVRLALAGQGCSRATPLLAGVVEGAGIAVVTGQTVGEMEAPRQRIAGVVGAQVEVVTHHGGTDARTLQTLVILRTGIAVLARTR